MFHAAIWFNKMCTSEKQGRNLLEANCKQLVIRQIKAIVIDFIFCDSSLPSLPKG